MMADKYERYLMKQKMKEARHQAKLDEIRRKRELAEIKDIKAKARSRNYENTIKLVVILLCVLLWIVAIAFMSRSR